MKRLLSLLLYCGLASGQALQSTQIWTSTFSAPAFTGTGQSDMTAAGYYSGGQTSITYCVKITATDHFSWGTGGSCTNGSASVAITGQQTSLGAGMFVEFGHTSGYTIGDQWTMQMSTLWGTGALAFTGAPPWMRFLGDGSAGAFSCTTGTCTLGNDEQWVSSLYVAAGATYAVSAGQDPLILRSTGPCIVEGTISISPLTDSGGVGFLPNQQTTGGGAGGGGGGGAATGTQGTGIFGRTSAAGGGPGLVGATGLTEGTGYLRTVLGSGGASFPTYNANGNMWGGSSGGQGGSSGGAGGKGAQSLWLFCPVIYFSGTIDARGGTGADSPGNSQGAGGGGGGGLVVMAARSFPINTGTANVSGGLGGGCAAFTGCGPGGPGGAGLFYQFVMQ